MLLAKMLDVDTLTIDNHRNLKLRDNQSYNIWDVYRTTDNGQL
jgi:hypothetical protein